LWKKQALEQKDLRITNELVKEVARQAESEPEEVWDFKE